MQEYFEFLELQNNATQTEIIQRIDEKQKLFSQLILNAPNDYLKTIHQKNISKLIEIKDALTKGYVEPKEQNNKETFIQNDNRKEVAWLIRHTEKKNAKTFSLYNGNNYIGRKSNERANEIIIDDDIYISRNHAKILIENGTCQIIDLDSKNGIYLNGNDKRISSTFVQNSDTIQIGTTKLVLKMASNNNFDSIVKEVDDSDYMKTIVIDIL